MAVGGGRSSGDAGVLRDALGVLRTLLPPEWVIDRIDKELDAGTGGRVDAVVWVREPGGVAAAVLVEAARAFAPRDVEVLVARGHRLLRQLDPGAVLLVVAQWLSPRTRILLEEAGVGYLDLSGNALLRLDRPALFVRLMGADQDPQPPRRGAVSLRGAAAGRVVRLLVDVVPPFTATAVAEKSGVSLPYVSRLLTMLDREALINRGRQGLVVGVDWAELLRRRAETYQVFGTNTAHGFVSSQGAREALRRMVVSTEPIYRAVTGSFAIGPLLEPVAAPSQLIVYVENVAATAQAMGLLPTDEGADVVLLTDFDYVVVDRPEYRYGYTVVRTSQLALDCLTGNGRLPAEGEALLAWMGRNEWRYPSIDMVEQRAEIYP